MRKVEDGIQNVEGGLRQAQPSRRQLPAHRNLRPEGNAEFKGRSSQMTTASNRRKEEDRGQKTEVKSLARGSAHMKLHSKLHFCHEGTKTQRDDVYFNLGALESLWLNE